MARGRAWICLVGCLLPAEGCTEGTSASPSVRVRGAGPAGAEPLASLVASPSRRLRRLSAREYDNVVRDLLGDSTRPATGFVTDAYPNGYDNGSAGLVVQSDQVVDYQGAAESIAATGMRSARQRLLGGCDAALQGPQACLDVFLSSFAARAFRRPLTPTEDGRLRDLFATEAAARGGGFDAAVQTVLEAILQSPQFLYREELGPADVKGSSGAPVRLTDYEVASELSFLLTGSIPDAELWAAVSSGAFTTRLDYEREATRLLQTDGARAAIRAFLHQWLATDQLAQVSKDPLVYPSFGPSTGASMAAELDRFFDDVLWTGSGSLRELFTSNRTFVDSSLAALYGVTPGTQPVQPPPIQPLNRRSWQTPATALGNPPFVPVALDPTLRPGILTRSGFLAAHSDADSSGPIARGVFILQSILCSPPRMRPRNVPLPPAASDPSVQNMTTRQRFANHVRNPACQACHSQIDGIGFGLEEFDGVGAFRAVENGQVVDSSGSVVGTGEIDGPFNGAGELATKLAASRVLSECYARQTYRYAMGQADEPGDLPAWLTAASSPDAEMTAVLVSIVTHPVFVSRKFE